MNAMTSKTYLTSDDLLTIEAVLLDAGLGSLHKERGASGRFLIRMMETGTSDSRALAAALQRELGVVRFRQCWRGASAMHRFATQGLIH